MTNEQYLNTLEKEKAFETINEEAKEMNAEEFIVWLGMERADV